MVDFFVNLVGGIQPALTGTVITVLGLAIPIIVIVLRDPEATKAKVSARQLAERILSILYSPFWLIDRTIKILMVLFDELSSFKLAKLSELGRKCEVNFIRWRLRDVDEDRLGIPSLAESCEHSEYDLIANAALQGD